jgi:hypothetical protein
VDSALFLAFLDNNMITIINNGATIAIEGNSSSLLHVKAMNSNRLTTAKTKQNLESIFS